MRRATRVGVLSPGDDGPHDTPIARAGAGHDAPRRPRSDGPRRGLRIAVIDESPLVLHGVRAMLVRDDTASRVQAAAEPGTRRPDPVDVTLVDPSRLRPTSGITLDTLLHDPAHGQVVVFAFDPSPRSVSEWLARGCAGFVDKGAPRAELVDVITSAATRPPGRALDPQPALTLHCRPDAWLGQAQGLSRRESQMICLISQGLTNHDISEHTYLSINTVKTYIRSAYHKLEVSRRAQAVRWGVQNGMLDATARHGAATPRRLPLPGQVRLSEEPTGELSQVGARMTPHLQGVPDRTTSSPRQRARTVTRAAPMEHDHCYG